jgi:hypothetical protein
MIGGLTLTKSMKKTLLGLLLFMQMFTCWAQQTSQVKGTVLDSKSRKPLQDIAVTLESTNLTITTNPDGLFIFENIAEGKQVILVRSAGYAQKTFNLDITPGQQLDLGEILLAEDITSEQQLSLITITENDLGDDNSGSDNTAGLLQASRDTYQQAAAFNWGLARFRIRGLDNEYGTTMINGVVMNKLYDGRPQWSNWGGLNDATRNQEFTMGSAPSDYTFGSILGTQQISTRASIYRPGTRISFSGTNTNYSWRGMGTYASGLNKDGFAFVVSASRRWSDEGYFEGTDYSANSFFASVEKRFGDKHSLNFTSIYAQNSRGKNSPNTQEVTDLKGEKYNSYWGWQDGKKRNSRDKDVEEPILMLSHYWNINEKNNLRTNVAYQFGQIGNSRIDYQDVANPDPTYYKNLPSYYTSMYLNENNTTTPIPAEAYHPGGVGGLYIGNQYSVTADKTRRDFLANSQLDWDGMYKANSTPITDGNGNIIGYTPAVSKYVLYEDRTDDKTFTANSVYSAQFTDYITFNAGATFRRLKSHNFQNMLDLLGGTHYNDIDSFYSGNQAQSDLNNPDRQIGVGDTFGYNYNLLADNYDAFAQAKFNYNNTEFYIGGNYSHSDYQREGLYRNGIYANNSFGKSEKVTFDNLGAKAGLIYKLTGRQMLSFNGVFMTKAPTLRNTFPNARLNNSVVAGLDSENIYSGDLSYIIRAPKLKARLTAFYSRIDNATETSFFFAEGVVESIDGDADTNAFVAETVTDISKQQMGLELGFEYQFTPTLKGMLSASYGQYTYANNPNVTLNNDALAADLIDINPGQINGASTNFGKADLKDYKLPGMPQQAASVGIEYRNPKFWWIGANANYLGANYIDVSALMRTDNFLIDPETGHQFIEIGTDNKRTRELLKQEKFDDFVLFNLTGGKSWRFGNNTFGFFASINNVFNTSYKTGGFEQARNANYRQLNQDVSSGTPAFGPKYFYGYGRTYFINLYINL